MDKIKLTLTEAGKMLGISYPSMLALANREDFPAFKCMGMRLSQTHNAILAAALPLFHHLPLLPVNLANGTQAKPIRSRQNAISNGCQHPVQGLKILTHILQLLHDRPLNRFRSGLALLDDLHVAFARFLAAI